MKRTLLILVIALFTATSAIAAGPTLDELKLLASAMHLRYFAIAENWHDTPLDQGYYIFEHIDQGIIVAIPVSVSSINEAGSMFQAAAISAMMTRDTIVQQLKKDPTKGSSLNK
jgi:hypothetical protein